MDYIIIAGETPTEELCHKYELLDSSCTKVFSFNFSKKSPDKFLQKNFKCLKPEEVDKALKKVHSLWKDFGNLRGRLLVYVFQKDLKGKRAEIDEYFYSEAQKIGYKVVRVCLQ